MLPTGHQLVAVTPAGRRRYLEVLAAHVLAEGAVDRWELWANTDDPADLAWMDALAAREPRVRVVRGSWPLEGTLSIHRYYRGCADPGTVYVRLDDDVAWAAPGAIRKLAERRVADPAPFILYGNTLNNALTTHLHQRAGRLPATPAAGYACLDPVGWRDGPFAVALHRAFLADPNPAKWTLPDHDLTAYERCSVNVVSWLGADLIGCDVGRDEEVWLACDEPERRGRPNRIAGDCLFAHFAFFTQRPAVDAAADVLAGYRKLAGLPT